MTLTAISLFAGIGGIDRGLEQAGIRTVAAVEIDDAARGVLATHFPDTHLFTDVTEVTGDDLRAVGFVPERGILTAGWPCQGNSVAGRRGGMGDARSGLWVHVARLLGELRPVWFLGENVPGLYSVNGGDDIAVVRGDLARLGYWWAERILDAQHFGVPQRRRRVIFVGHLGDRAAPVEVLLEPEGGHWDPAPRRETGPDVAGTLDSRAGGSRSTDLDGHGAYVTPVSTLQGGGVADTGSTPNRQQAGTWSPTARRHGHRSVVAALTANGVGTCGPDDNQAQAGHLIATDTHTHTELPPR